MSDVFIVCGESGEYSAWTHWVVRAFTTEAGAQAFVDAAQAYVAGNPPAEAYPFYTGSAEYEAWLVRAAAWIKARRDYFTLNTYDTKMDDGVIYSIEQVPMGSEAP